MTIGKLASFAKDELSLTLTDGQLEVLEGFEAGGYSQAVWSAGRRGGKSTLADVVVLFDAIARDQLREHLMPGEPRIAGIVAQDHIHARRHIARCAAWVRRNPKLARLLVSETADELTFSNGSVIAAFPCSARSLRGDAWSCAVLDELGHYTDTTDGNASGERVYEAVEPSLAQFAEAGWLISISTPRWRQGMFWKLVQRGQSGTFPRLHYIHKTSLEMNSRLSAEYLAEKQRENPDNYRREYLAEFSDAGAFLDSLDVLACVRRGEGVLPPVEGIHYRAAIDPAFERDNFALAIAHREQDAVIVDGVWTWRAGFEVTLDQVTAVVKEYRLRDVVTDQHAAAAILDGLKRRGLTAVVRDWTNATKYNAYTRLKAALQSRTIELPDDEALVSELLNLEAVPTPSGLTKIAAAGSAHDDRASVLAALAQEMIGRIPAQIVAPPLGMTGRSVWLSEGQPDDAYEIAAGSHGLANVGAPPRPTVPVGAVCAFVNRDGRPCGSERFHEDGRCIRCDHWHSSVGSPGPSAPMPVLMTKH
jgi:hypothetical protein